MKGKRGSHRRCQILVANDKDTIAMHSLIQRKVGKYANSRKNFRTVGIPNTLNNSPEVSQTMAIFTRLAKRLENVLTLPLVMQPEEKQTDKKGQLWGPNAAPDHD